MGTLSMTIFMETGYVVIKPGPQKIQFLPVEFKRIVKGWIFGVCGRFLVGFLGVCCWGVFFNLNLEIEKDKYTETVFKISRLLQPELQNLCCSSHVTNGAQSRPEWHVAKHEVLSQVPDLDNKRSLLLPAIFACWPTL